MTTVSFEIQVPMRASLSEVWLALIDWASHGDWIPATRSRILNGEGGLGTEFEAVSGYGPLALVDRMRVATFEPERASVGIEKVGPVLGGVAGFTLTEVPEGCVVSWYERVTVPHLPGALAPIAGRVGAVMFRWAIRRLDAMLRH